MLVTGACCFYDRAAVLTVISKQNLRSRFYIGAYESKTVLQMPCCKYCYSLSTEVQKTFCP